MEKKFIAVTKDLLICLENLISEMWCRGGLDFDFRVKHSVDFNKAIGELRDLIKGKEQEICPVCGEFLTRDHDHETKT